MATIVTRAGKGSPLTFAEVDANFTNLNNGKIETTGGTLTGPTVVDVNSASTALRITQTGTGNALLVEDSANPDATPFVIDASGTVVVGATVPTFVTGVIPAIQSLGTGNAASTLTARYSNDTEPPRNWLFKSRSGTIGGHVIVNNGDDLAQYRALGSDGTNYINSGQIAFQVDGVPGTDDMPGRITFSTTADGAASVTERMRIDSVGRVGIGTTPIGARTLTVGANITGAALGVGIGSVGVIQSDVTTARYFRTAAGTQAAAFTLPNLEHFVAESVPFGAGSSVTNQYGFIAANTLTGATNNYGFRSDLIAATGRWNFYANGTADNYFAGRVGIATTTPTFHHQVALGSATDNRGIAVTETTYTANFRAVYINYYGTSATGSTYGVTNANLGLFSFQNTANGLIGTNGAAPLIFATNSLERMRIDSTGKVGIGGTPASNMRFVIGGTQTLGANVQVLLNQQTIQSDATGVSIYYDTFANLQAATFNSSQIIHYRATQAALSGGATITTQRGFMVENNLTGATNNQGFFGGLAAGTGCWNVYMAGTADNYFAGNVGVGSNTPTAKLNVVESGTQDAVRITNTGTGNSLVVEDSANPDATPFVVTAAGNVGIGTSAATTKLTIYDPTTTDVNINSDGGLNVRLSKYSADAVSGALNFRKSRGTFATPAAVVSGDTIGISNYSLHNGTTFEIGSVISSFVDTYTGSGNFDTSLRFSTKSGTAAIGERMRITGAGNIGIGTVSPDASAKLDITSTTSGVLFPRMTTTQRDAISTPANGLVLYNTTTDKLQVRAAGAWVDLH